MGEEYIRIIDNDSKIIIAQGKIINKKIRGQYHNEDKSAYIYEDIFMPSVDNKHFFNSKSKKLVFEYIDEKVETYVNIPSDYIVEKWKHYKFNRESDIYIDKDIFGIDEEVKRLVQSLNKIQYIETVGSCSGHGEYPLYVDIKFFDFQKFILFTRLINNKFFDKFVLKTSPSIKQIDFNCVILRLESIQIGEEAYNSANRLAQTCDILFLGS